MTSPRDATTLFQRDTEVPLRATRERFAPGAIVAGRYRIVALLGRGGMGEVYRADDLRLDQQVALKFLPPRLQSNPEALELFLGELRLGRQVSHPNVCRLYDLGDHDGHDFITMEYVDGEDLASLLKRIGKLPEEKAIQIARDIAAGLAAAHALGIVHRDLKPSNVMIDGKGRARVTDFGLAVLERNAERDGRIVGTPAYMAPEQFTGAEATPRSDVYALGLILYELLTGQPLHRGDSGEAIIRERIRNTSSGSINALPEIDQAVDRLLRRCLDPDPAQRPESAQVVLRSLPGGDPLAAAVAAGETPSPELVASATSGSELSLRASWTLLVLMIATALAAAIAANRTMLYRRLAIRSPEGLADRAADIAPRFANAPARDSGWFTQYDLPRVAWMYSLNATDWDAVVNMRPGPLRFIYRQSPRPMVPLAWDSRLLENDPPLNVPGMARLIFDHRGRLLELVAVPPARMANAVPFDGWEELFALAELPMNRFTPVQPSISGPVPAEERRAWRGTLEGSTLPLRIEAAASGGKPVWFAVLAPWHLEQPPVSLMDRIGDGARMVMQAIVPPICLVLAFLNLRRGRGDRRGAFRLAVVGFVTILVARLFRAHHAAAPEEVLLLQRIIGESLFVSALLGMAYLALEPYVRRYTPEALISWVRVVHGRFRDAQVNRDVLIGAAAGAACVAMWHVSLLIHPLFGFGPAMPLNAQAGTSLGGLNDFAYLQLWNVTYSITDGINIAVLMVLFRAITKRAWLATLLVHLVATIVLLRVAGDAPQIRIIFAAASAALALFVLKRAGVLGLTMMALTANIYASLPLTLDPDAYYFGRAAVALLIPLTIGAMAFWNVTQCAPTTVAETV